MEEKKCCCAKTTSRSEEQKKKLLNRLKRIEGQVRGLQTMIENQQGTSGCTYSQLCGTGYPGRQG